MRHARHHRQHGRSLNVILTVNAVLLAGLLWTHLINSDSGTAALAQSAGAYQPPADVPGGATSGIPNAAGQRQRQIEELQHLRASVDALKKILEAGKMKVIVANADELRAASNNNSAGK